MIHVRSRKKRLFIEEEDKYRYAWISLFSSRWVALRCLSDVCVCYSDLSDHYFQYLNACAVHSNAYKLVVLYVLLLICDRRCEKSTKVGICIFLVYVSTSICVVLATEWRLSHMNWTLCFEVTLRQSRSLRDSVFVEKKHFLVFRILVNVMLYA